jgi:alkanesulfonate monooxygenase SsuD/methylene tetrahydromethanopterin reductase-like flavin-dependent oxidoreductase (luciferase family)
MTLEIGLALPLTSAAPTVTALLDELIEEAVAAERAGFDMIFVPEHRQGPRVTYCAPLVVAAQLLAHTTSIRVATGVLVLPSHHPVHVAETATMLDHASSGRFVLGVGAGYQPEDLAPFGVGLDDRAAIMDESLTVLHRLFTESKVTHHGASFALDGVRLRPPPLTTSGPPVWLGSWSRGGTRRAARLCDGWIADPIRTTAEIETMAGYYRQACAEAGRADAGKVHAEKVIVMREAWLADDELTARRTFARLIEPVFDYYHRRGAFPEGGGDFDALAADRFVLGSAATITSTVEDIVRRTGAAAVVLQLRHPGGPSHSEALDHIAEAGKALTSTSVPSSIQGPT